MWLSELLGVRQEYLKWDNVGEIDTRPGRARASCLANSADDFMLNSSAEESRCRRERLGKNLPRTGVEKKVLNSLNTTF